MSKLVMIDSQIFIWGIKGQSTQGQEAQISKARAFIHWLSENDYKILLPVPQMVELLSCVPVLEQDTIRQYFDRRFRIVPFDEIAGTKCAELIHLSLTTAEIVTYREEQKVTKNKLKFDCMLVAIAITRGVSKIYSNDGDLKRFANGQIDVIPMPNILTQTQLSFSPPEHPPETTTPEHGTDTLDDTPF